MTVGVVQNIVMRHCTSHAQPRWSCKSLCIETLWYLGKNCMTVSDMHGFEKTS